MIALLHLVNFEINVQYRFPFLHPDSISGPHFSLNDIYLGQLNGLRLGEPSDPGVGVLGPHREVVLVPTLELGEGARHGQGERLDVAHLLPERDDRRGRALLVGKDLVAGHPGVVRDPQVHVPGQNDSRFELGDLQGRPGRGSLPLPV